MMNRMIAKGRFKYCLGIILEHEGGLTNDKDDPGGITKWGISLRFLRSIGLDIDGDGDVDEDDIRAVEESDAEEIYRKYWWDKYQYNNLESLAVAAKVFDLSVNMGAMAAHKVLQNAINKLTDHKVVINGILGPQTLRSANSLDSNELRQALRDCAKDKYSRIIAANPSMAKFEKGWYRRAAW